MPKAIPDGYHAITPYISCRDAAKAIDFYKQALGAKEIYRLPMPSGKFGHAELKIGDSMFMLADESQEWGNKSAKNARRLAHWALLLHRRRRGGRRQVLQGGRQGRSTDRASVIWRPVGPVRRPRGLQVDPRPACRRRVTRGAEKTDGKNGMLAVPRGLLPGGRPSRRCENDSARTSVPFLVESAVPAPRVPP